MIQSPSIISTTLIWIVVTYKGDPRKRLIAIFKILISKIMKKVKTSIKTFQIHKKFKIHKIHFSVGTNQ